MHRHKNRSKLDAHQIAKLVDLGFVWNSYQDAWNLAADTVKERLIKVLLHLYLKGYLTEDGYILWNWVTKNKEKFRSIPIKRKQ